MKNSTVFERRPPARSTIEHSLSPSRRASFWIDDAPGDRYETLRTDIDCDLAVVGGGYTGLWTALLAKRRDPARRIVLLEGRRIGWAASGRNGGFCEASLTHGEENGLSRWPAEYDTLAAMGRANLDEIEQIVGELGLDADFERNGAIDLATEAHQVPWLQEAATDDDLFLNEAEVRRRVNSPTYLAGLHKTRDSALVHPAKLARALARACAEAGVLIFENTPVSTVDSNTAGSTAAVTPHAVVRSTHLALATNVFPSLLRRNRLATVPVYDYVLMTEPLQPQQLETIGWHGREGLGDTANQFHYYRLSADNRILFGGYDAIYRYGGRMRERYEDRPESFERLASHFFTTFPQLEGLQFSHRWAGAIDTCSRFCAFFGTARQGRVAYATGYTGLGVAASHFGANVMLDLLAGEKTERTELEMVRSRPLPFPPEPVAALGINLTRWSLDRADHRHGRRNVLLKAMDAVGLGFDS